MTLTHLFVSGLLFDLLGIALIGLDLVGLRRIQRFEDGLRSYLRDVSTPLVTPAYIFQTFMDLFYSRRRSFWFFMLAPLPMLPQYSTWVLHRLPIAGTYVDLLQIVWLFVGGFTLLLLVLAGLVRLAAIRRDRYPIWVDHLVAVSAFPWRASLVLTLPAAILFVALPIVFNYICVKVLLYALYAVTAFCSHLSLRQPGQVLRTAGMLLLSLGFAIQIYASF